MSLGDSNNARESLQSLVFQHNLNCLNRTCRMRIDLIITELDNGGAEKCCAALASYLHSQGHGVRVIALGREPTDSRNSLAVSLREQRIELHFLGGSSVLALPKVMLKLRRLIRADRPEIAQSFLWHANVVSAAIYPAFHIPVIGGVRVAEPRTSRHAIGAWAARRSAHIVCVSSGVANWCQQFEKVAPEKISVIPNGISIDDVPNRTESKRDHFPAGLENRKLLLFIGRLEHQKGIDILLARSDSLLKQLPDFDMVLLGEGSYRPACEQHIRASEFGKRIHLMGHRKDAMHWIQRSEIVVLPTRYEGMPNVILEAMAAGRTVVTTRVEGIAELLGDTVESQSVPVGNWDDFESRVVEIANNAPQRQSLGHKNLERCRAHFQLADQMRAYEQLFERILSRTSDATK